MYRALTFYQLVSKDTNSWNFILIAVKNLKVHVKVRYTFSDVFCDNIFVMYDYSILTHCLHLRNMEHFTSDSWMEVLKCSLD